MTIDWQSLVARNPMLGCIPAGLRDAARLKPFARGETLFRQGERPRLMLYIVAGELRLLRRTPDGGEMILQRASGERLSLNSAAERILHYLETQGDNGVVTLTMSRKAWATELGLSHEALYRTLRRLQDDGVVWIDGLYIHPGNNQC
jgi:CRP-like cAMP-binding protein